MRCSTAGSGPGPAPRGAYLPRLVRLIRFFTDFAVELPQCPIRQGICRRRNLHLVRRSGSHFHLFTFTLRRCCGWFETHPQMMPSPLVGLLRRSGISIGWDESSGRSLIDPRICIRCSSALILNGLVGHPHWSGFSEANVIVEVAPGSSSNYQRLDRRERTRTSPPRRLPPTTCSLNSFVRGLHDRILG